jgi:acyl-CoA thioesterase I
MDAYKTQFESQCKSQSTRRAFFRALALLGLAASLAAAPATRTLLFFGDSLTAGYGLDPDEAYPALIGQRIEEAGLPWRVVNAGLSGETTSGGLRRLDWILRQRVDMIVLELGGNDGLRGLPTDVSRANLQAMIDRVRERYPDCVVVLAGMQIPTNMGEPYRESFAAIFPELAERNGVHLIPFLLEGVGGVPELNLPDGIHPNARGQQIVADNVWRVVGPLLRR